jgi:hypothetical protein
VTAWVDVTVRIRAEHQIEHHIKIDSSDYAEWLEERGYGEATDDTLAAFIGRDEDWYEQFDPGTLVEDELMDYAIDSAEERK